MKIYQSAKLAAALATVALAGCGMQPPASMPSGPAAYDAIPVTITDPSIGTIAPGDRLAIKVLGEPELTSDQYLVDTTGIVEMPLIGDVTARGRTVEAIRDEITMRLGRRFIRDPQVTVSLVQHHREVYTVEGEVKEPGRYEIASDMTLLGAIATAKGTGINARISEVIVMRDLNGQHMAARFNMDAIRLGRVPDPQIIAGDKIVVGYSVGKGAWHDFLQAAPLFNTFYLFRN